MSTDSEPMNEAEAPPRIRPDTESGERLPQMIERTRRRGRRRRAPVFTPQEVKTIDYKDVDRLKKLISDRGRIEPRRKTGLTAKDQRKIAREIKRARLVALLPYTAEHMRQTSRFRMVTRMAQRAMRAEIDDAPPTTSDGAEASTQTAAPAPDTSPETTPSPVDAAPTANPIAGQVGDDIGGEIADPVAAPIAATQESDN